MHIVVSKNTLGTDDNLVYDGKNFHWSKSAPLDSWKLGFDDEIKDISIIASAIGESLLTFDSTPGGKAARFVYGDATIPWAYVLPRDVFQKQLIRLLDQLWLILNDESNGYYMDQFLINREVLMSLSPPRVDLRKANNIINRDDSPKALEIERFLPISGEIAPKTTYSQTGSVTGRLTVKSGPNILTLKKEYRKILKSRFKGGKIIQIDISSLEPRIALAIAEKAAPLDIYDHIGNTVLEKNLSRDEVKIAVFNCIYGGSEWSLSQRLPKCLDAKSIMSSIIKYFKIDSLKTKLEKEANSSGFIENLYGRRIDSNSAVVNHYLQSSGVDVSFNVFSQLIKKIADKDVVFYPIYIIHDAIVADISKDSYREIKEICSEGFNIDKLDCKFPVKIEIIKE